MNRKIVLLNIFLGALLIWIGVRIRAYWLESKARENAAIERAVKPQPPLPPPPVPGVESAQAASYLDVAQHMLFSKDRDPNVIIEVQQAPPPPPPPPPPPTPAFPRYHGQMAFGEPVLVMSTEKTPQKSYRKGDKVGEFVIAEFDRDTVTLEWNDTTFKEVLKDLVPKEAERPAAIQAAQSAPAAQTAPSIAKMGGTTSSASAKKSDPVLGPQNGMYRGCVDGDASPDGTVKDGFRKVIVRSLMGQTCQWEPIR